MINPMTSAAAAMNATAGHAAYSIQDKGGGAASREFVVNVLSVSAGVLVATPTDDSVVSFIIYGNGP
jgi:hypothetical protein